MTDREKARNIANIYDRLQNLEMQIDHIVHFYDNPQFGDMFTAQDIDDLVKVIKAKIENTEKVLSDMLTIS